MKEKKSFSQWMTEVDGWCEKLFGLSVYDLPDAPFADWYDSGVGPQVAAKRAMAEDW